MRGKRARDTQPASVLVTATPDALDLSFVCTPALERKCEECDKCEESGWDCSKCYRCVV